jgi:hypothetical protein
MFSYMQKSAQPRSMSLFKGFVIYALLYLILNEIMWQGIYRHWDVPTIFQALWAPYLIFGLILNRVVFKGLTEWHPTWNTLGQVAGTKIRMLIFWPFAYPVLFLRLAIAKYL